jgi:quercetin dioxygenase-like cupin family protein
MKFVFAIALTGFSIPSVAQSQGKEEIFSSTDLRDQLVQIALQAKASGSRGSTLGEYGTHALKLSERTASGGAEIHAHFDDVVLVMEGKKKLIAGGDVIDAHAGSNGETTVSGISNGIVQTIAAGDVAHIPAGMPHQLLIAHGTAYSAFAIEMKE